MEEHKRPCRDSVLDPILSRCIPAQALNYPRKWLLRVAVKVKSRFTWK